MSGPLKLLVIAGIAIMVVGPVSNADELEYAVNMACLYHPQSHAAGLLVEEAESRISEARSAILPQIGINSQIGLTEDFEETAQILDNGRPISTRLTLNQPIYLGGRGRARIRGAKEAVKVQQYQSIRQIHDVQIGAIQAYIDLARAKSALSVREENLSVLEQRRKDSERRFQLGAGTKTDIVQAEARIERGHAEIVGARREIREALAAYFEATGYEPEEDLALPSYPVLPEDFAGAWEIAQYLNPDINAAKSQINVARQNIKTIRNSFEPEISLVGDIGADRDTAFNGFERDDARVSINMNIPLFSGGGNRARKKQSLLAERRSFYQRNIAMNNIVESLSSAWAQYEASLELIEVNQNLVDVSRKAAVSVKKEADAGFRPSIDVLDAQQELLEANLAVSESKFQSVLAAYIVKALMGDLSLPNTPDCIAAMPNMSDKKHVSPLLELPIISDLPIISNIRLTVPKKDARTRRRAPGK